MRLTLTCLWLFVGLGLPLTAAAAPPSVLQALMTAKLSQDTFDDEATDFEVEPLTEIFTGKFSEPTPTHVPGAKVINTGELLRMLQSNQDPIIIDVGSGRNVQSVPNAVYWRNVGNKKNPDKAMKSLRHFMQEITWAGQERPIIFMAGINAAKNKVSKRWLSYNATLRAVQLGYENIYWYRGGRDAWIAAGLPTRSLMPPHLREAAR